MPKTICTIQDVADHLGAAHPTNESISRRVYKDTSCGAWAKVEERTKDGPAVSAIFRADFRSLPDGRWYLRLVYRNGRHMFTTKLPPQLREYLCIDADGICTTDLGAVVPGGEIERVTRTKGKVQGKVLLTFRLTVPFGPTSTELVFCVGSIVEGTDAEVFPETVVLPCTGAQIDKAIACVESAADDIWQETHGCDDCNTDEHDHRINPDCLSCGGDGAMI